MGNSIVGRRALLTQSLALGGLAALEGCAAPMQRRITGTVPGLLVPMRMSVNQLIDVKCCIRPFRAAGPRLDAEQIGNTLVIHNYGHGGSGWSLSWGSAEIALGKAMSVLPKDIAVIGCGIVGLSAAIVAQRWGLNVTIYARDPLPRTRSIRANGSWTPDSRISLTEPAGPGFGDLWEQMARISWKSFRSYLGLAEKPVEFADSYALSDEPFRSEADRHKLDPAIASSFATTGMPAQKGEFGRYADRIRDIVPQSEPLSGAENPFPVKFARRTSQMHFNFSSYGQLLLSEFFSRGGKFVMRDFHSPADVAALEEKVVINCPGYSARDLWRDPSIIPVRGQTGWLVPQPDANYALNYRNVNILSKSDGVMVMHTSATLGDMEGVGNSLELPDRTGIEDGIKIVAPLFATMKGARA